MAGIRNNSNRFAFIPIIAALTLSSSHKCAQAFDNEINTRDPYISAGYLPVTYFGAIPDDQQDDTAAIQQAIDTARDKHLVAYFPMGTYIVSDTLRAMQRVVYDPLTKRYAHQRDTPNVLQGESRTTKLSDGTEKVERAVLKLADNAAGFNTPSMPKPLIWIWSQPFTPPKKDTKTGKADKNASPPVTTDPEKGQANISFDQVFRSLDIDLRAEGNMGAVGINHAGSQGSTLEDVTIQAEGAYAGIMNPPGQGGGSYNIKVVGGDFGIWANFVSRYPVAAGVTLTDQKKAAIFWQGQSNLTLAGYIIQAAKSHEIAPVEIRGGQGEASGTLTLIDGIIDAPSPSGAIKNSDGRSVAIDHLWMRGTTRITSNSTLDALATNSNAFSGIEKYAFAPPNHIIADNDAPSANTTLNRASVSEFVKLAPPSSPVPASGDLLARHLWPSTIASLADTDALTATAFGAIPDDGKDDSAAINAALRARPTAKVFLPKGIYNIASPVILPKDAQLFGVAKHLSVLRESDDWQGEETASVIETTAEPKSKAMISFLRIEISRTTPNPALSWHAGKDSFVRDIMIGPNRAQPWVHWSKPLSSALSRSRTELIRISGGGTFYGIAAEWNAIREISRGSGYSHLRISNNTAPVTFYGLNVERSLSSPQIDLNNAHDVTMFYLKGETLDEARSTVVRTTDTSNFAVYGFSGNAAPLGGSLFEIANSSGITLRNIAQVNPSAQYFSMLETREDKTTGLYRGDNFITVYTSAE